MRKFSMLVSEQKALAKGIPPAPRDHPIYSEGSTFTFLSFQNKGTRVEDCNATEKVAPKGKKNSP